MAAKRRQVAPSPEQVSAEYAMLSELVQTLGGTLSAQSVREQVLQVVHALTGAERIYMALQTLDGNWEASALVKGRAEAGQWQPTALTEKVLASGEPLVLDAGAGYPGVRSYIGVPLRRGHLSGVLEVFNLTSPQRLDDYERSLELVANVAGMALRNADLFAQTGEYAERSQAMTNILSTATRSLDLPVLLKEVTALASQVVGVERCSVLLLDESGKTLSSTFTHWSETATPPTASLIADIGEIPGGREAILTGQPQVFEDLLTVSKHAQTRLTREYGTRSLLVVPLIVGDAALGTMNLATVSAPRRFSDSQISFAQDMARYMAPVIRNALLHREVETTRREWQSTFDSASDGLAILDADFTILQANQALAVLANAPVPEALVAQPCYRAVYGLAQPPEEWLQGRERKQYVDFLWRDTKGNGRWLSAHLDPIVDASGTVTRFVYTVQDVTQKKQLEELKDDFIGMVSHELNTPLTVVLGAISVLRSDLGRLDPDDIHQLLEDASTEAESMRQLVRNLLDLSRADANRLIMQDARVNASEVLAEVCAKVRRRRSEHHFVIDAPETLPPLKADRIRVERVLYNLMDNAAKYSPPGTEVCARACVQGDSLLFSVTNQGQGIPPEDQAKLFQPFQRLGRGGPGTGIGLVVCRRLVEAQGGSIWVESEPGQGATFHFTLPLGNQE